jgi:hypothetical protein
MFAKFTTEDAALQYLPVIQAHVDGLHVSGPKVIKAVIPTFDGKWAIPLPETYPETSGEVVENIDPPVVEMEL